MVLLPQMSVAMKGHAKPMLVSWRLCTIQTETQNPPTSGDRAKARKKDREDGCVEGFQFSKGDAIQAPTAYHEKLDLSNSTSQQNCTYSAGHPPARMNNDTPTWMELKVYKSTKSSRIIPLHPALHWAT